MMYHCCVFQLFFYNHSNHILSVQDDYFVVQNWIKQVYVKYTYIWHKQWNWYQHSMASLIMFRMKICNSCYSLAIFVFDLICDHINDQVSWTQILFQKMDNMKNDIIKEIWTFCFFNRNPSINDSGGSDIKQ